MSASLHATGVAGDRSSRVHVRDPRAKVVGLLGLTLVAVTALHVASFGDTRFHLPWVPLLAVLAARAFAPLAARPWTLARQTVLAMWLVAFALVWTDQAAELMAVLPTLAESPVPLALPY